MNTAEKYVFEQVKKRHPQGVLVSKCWPPSAIGDERKVYIAAAQRLASSGTLVYSSANDCYYLPEDAAAPTAKGGGKTSSDLRATLFATLEDVRCGALDVKTAQAVINAADSIMKCAELELRAMELAARQGVKLDGMGALLLTKADQ